MYPAADICSGHRRKMTFPKTCVETASRTFPGHEDTSSKEKTKLTLLLHIIFSPFS
jgi:hypothetical protein